MKRVLRGTMSLLLVGVMGMGCLSGCSKEELVTNVSTDASVGLETTTAVTAETNNEEEESGKLIIWGGTPAESGPQAVVDKWNSENPNFPAEYVRYVNDDSGNTKLDTALLSGEQIDLYFSHMTDLLYKRVESGMAADLTEFGAEQFIEEEVLGGLEGTPPIDGKVYFVPTNTETIGVLINQSMLDEKGITIPENWTMDEFMDICEQLSGEVDGKKIYGTTVFYEEMLLPIAKANLGGDWMYKSDTESNFDHPSIKVNSKMKEMLDNGSAMPYEEIISRKMASYAHPAFLNGEIAMMPAAVWMLRYISDYENFPHDFITTFAKYPAIDENTPTPYVGNLSSQLCINSNSENKEKSWEFIQFYVREVGNYMPKVPTWLNADEEEVTAVILGENPEKTFDVQAYKDVMLQEDRKFLLTTKTDGLSQITQIYKDETDKYLLGELSEEEYYINLKTKSDKILEE